MASAVYHPPTNKIYVFGGADPVTGTNYDTTRIYDAATNSWTAGAPLPDVRSFMASGYDTVGTCIYLVGGYRTGDVTSAQNQVWALCPGRAHWTSRAPIPHAVGGAAFWILGGHMYVAGGRDATDQVLDLCWDYNIAAELLVAPATLCLTRSTCPAAHPLPTADATSSAEETRFCSVAVWGKPSSASTPS